MTERHYYNKTLEPPIHKLVLSIETALEKSPESAIKMLKNIRGKISKGIDMEILVYLLTLNTHYNHYHCDRRYEKIIEHYPGGLVKKAERIRYEMEMQCLIWYRGIEIPAGGGLR